jgi:hypothetical protein
MVWSQLNRADQQDFINRVLSGENVVYLAGQYGLKPQSLKRKIRKLKAKGQLVHKDIPAIDVSRVVESAGKIASTTFFSGELLFKFVTSNFNLFNVSVDNLEQRYYDRTMRVTTNGPIHMLLYSDAHFGDESVPALKAFLRAAEYLPHDLIVNLGDTLDLYGLSKYGKDHNGIFRKSVGKEVKRWKSFLKRLEEVSDCPKFILGGNHVRRYYAWLDEQVGMHDLEALELERIMALDTGNYAPMVDAIYFDPSDSASYPNPKFVMIHGSLSRKHSGSTSRGHSENLGYNSVAVGHVHRLGVNVRRTMAGPVTTIETGCLCNLDPDYMKFPDWTNGFVYVTYDKGNVFANPIMIIDGEAYLNGKKI